MLISQQPPFAVPCTASIFRSADGGQTWTEHPLADPDACIYELYDGSGTHVFARTRVGVFRSTDDGLTWRRIEAPAFPGAARETFFAHPSGHAAALTRADVLTADTVYTSVDDGHTWQAVALQKAYAHLEEIAISAQGTLLGQGRRSLGNGDVAHEVLRSTDGGVTWTLLWSEAREVDIYVVGPDLYVNVHRGAFRHSSDDGASWQEIPHNFTSILSAVPSDEGILAGTTRGVFHVMPSAEPSLDAWMSRSTGINRSYMITLAKGADGAIYAGGFWGDLWHWLPQEDGWELLTVNSAQSGMTIRGIVATDGGQVLLMTNGRTLQRSADGGTAWTDVDEVDDVLPPRSMEIAQTKAGTILVTQDEGVARSTDSGLTWSTPVPLPNVLSLWCDERRVLAATDDGLYGSDDDGQSWRRLGLAGLRVLAVTASGPYLYASVSASDSDVTTPEGLLYRSTDHGTTWTPVWQSYFEMVHMVVTADGTLYGTDYGYQCSDSFTGLCSLGRSSDGGATWTPFQTGLPGADTSSVTALLVTDEGHLLASTFGRGVYQTRAPVVPTHRAEDDQIPSGSPELVLFPNPVREVLTVTFDVQHPSYVMIALYDATGRLVRRLAHGQYEPGRHDVRWRPDSLAAGSYWCRARIGEATITRSEPIYECSV